MAKAKKKAPRGRSPEISDEDVEREIERLSKSEAVKIAKKEKRINYKRRQQLYQLRSLAKRGAKLKAAGINLETIDTAYKLVGLGEKLEDVFEI